jgi:hypothetical protein
MTIGNIKRKKIEELKISSKAGKTKIEYKSGEK